MENSNPKSQHEIARQLYFDNGGRIHQIHLDGFSEEYAAGIPTEKMWKEELICHYRKRLREETNATVLASITDALRYHGDSGMKEILMQRYSFGNTEAKIAAAYACWKGLGDESGALLLIELFKVANKLQRKEIRSHMNYMRESCVLQEFVIEVLNDPSSGLLDEILNLLDIWTALNANSFKDAPKMSELKTIPRSNPCFNAILDEAIKAIRNCPKIAPHE